jgi:hypothetical protein
MRLPSRLKITRRIMRPVTVAWNPSVQAGPGLRDVVMRGGRRSLAVPRRVGVADRLAGGAWLPEPLGPPEPGGVELLGVPGLPELPGLPGVGVGEGAEVDVPHIEPSMTLLIRLTWPLRASMRPWTVAALFSEIDVSAIRLPLNAVVVPSVAELPTCQ